MIVGFKLHHPAGSLANLESIMTTSDLSLKQLVKPFVPGGLLDAFRRYKRDAKNTLVRNRAYYERSERQELMRKSFTALSFNGISGDYLEFGSWGAMTFALAYKESRRANFHCKLWSFDSFRGLPPQAGAEDEHPVWVEGTMSTSLEEFRAICRSKGISDEDYFTVPGYYEDTITQEDKIGLSLPKDVAIAYIDCDLHSSTKTVLRFLSSRMKHG